MARKPKGPPEKPSKAYLVSFGDTMTALLAFFIVLNSFAKEQTGSNMYSGTGSFVNAMSSIGLPGGAMGNRSKQVIQKKSPSPVYAVQSPEENRDPGQRDGPDQDPDDHRIIDRQMEGFKRFLSNVNKDFDVNELPPTRSQIVFDSFEKFRRPQDGQLQPPLQKDAIQIASEAIMRLGREDFRLEIVVWANIPSQIGLKKAMVIASGIQQQIESIFNLTDDQKSRFCVTAKPWLFSDAARPKASFVISRINVDESP